MEAVFLKILNMSINAGWLVLAVLVLRLVFKKAPKALTVAMWALVGLRLLCPFTIESALSLLPSGETVPEQFLSTEAERINIHLSGQIDWTQPVMDSVTVPAPQVEVPSDPSLSLTQLVAMVWLVGVAVMLIYASVSYLLIRRKVREAAPMWGRIWQCDRIGSPFILGLFRPRIYLPSSLNPGDTEYVIAHEKAHLKRKDHWWKPLGFLLLSIHWFNPLLWLGYIFLCRDIELACDEAVLRKLGTESKKPYSEALLNCSLPRRTLAACPLAFGEVGVKSRIKSVLNYKKPALWIILAAVLTCAVVAVCFLTNPKTTMPDEMKSTVNSAILQHHRSYDADGRACCTDYEILGIRKYGRTTKLYLSVLYEEYSLKDGALYGQTGSHIPTVITLRREDGSYTLKEYWEPRDGSYYPKDIRKKFPMRLWDKALDTQRYAEKLHRSCEEQAWAQLKNTLQKPQSEAVELVTLKQKYPQYFGLSTTKGLEIYVWQMGSDAYSWVLCEGRNCRYTWEELLKLPIATTEEIRTIVAYYGLPNSAVTVCPIAMPHSSYSYNIDEAYRKRVEDLFWTDFPSVQDQNYGVIIDTKTFDIDGDGIEESCTLGPGLTSGLFTFTLSVSEEGIPEYYNVYSGPFYYLSFAMGAGGQICLRGQTQGAEPEVRYFYFGVEDGNITLTGDGEPFAYWGDQGVKDRNQTQVPDLDLAIARAVQECHSSELPDGLLHTQSYLVLEQEQLSGTPLVGQEDHVQGTRVYLMVLEMRYSVEKGEPQQVNGRIYPTGNGKLKRVSGRIHPTVITFTLDAEGGYVLDEYWSVAREDWEAMGKFSPSAAEAWENMTKYEDALEENCDMLARQMLYMQGGVPGETYDQWRKDYDRFMRIFPD